MKFRRCLFMGISILSVVSLMGCSVVSAFSPTETPTLTPVPTSTLTPTMTPTPTEIPFYLEATVWAGDLKVPILLYHHFIANYAEKSNATKTRYADFTNQLQMLYDNGFSLISLRDWLNGTFILAEGKKPLIITLDDLWFADQLYINEDGTPSNYSGIGILWEFSKTHPDFGFSASVFSNMGDKFYADKHVEDYFFISDGNADVWKKKLGETIAWAVENGVDPYNHLYKHPLLSLMTNPSDILWQIEMNDIDTRYFLSLVGRDDLIPGLGNMIALPFGEWPATAAGLNAMKNYKDPEGKPLQAIFEAYNLSEKEFTPSVFTPGFDAFKIARLTASDYMVNWIVEQKNEIPSAAICKLGPLPEEQSNNIEVIQTTIQNAVSSQICPEGVYNVSGNVFVAKEGAVVLFRAEDLSEMAATPTLTPTSTP